MFGRFLSVVGLTLVPLISLAIDDDRSDTPSLLVETVVTVVPDSCVWPVFHSSKKVATTINLRLELDSQLKLMSVSIADSDASENFKKLVVAMLPKCKFAIDTSVKPANRVKFTGLLNMYFREGDTVPLAKIPELDRAVCPYYYPDESKALGEQGYVHISAYLDETGKVLKYSLGTSSGYPRLDAAALLAFSKCKMKPGKTVEGKSVGGKAGALYVFRNE